MERAFRWAHRTERLRLLCLFPAGVAGLQVRMYVVQRCVAPCCSLEAPPDKISSAVPEPGVPGMRDELADEIRGRSLGGGEENGSEEKLFCLVSVAAEPPCC